MTQRLAEIRALARALGYRPGGACTVPGSDVALAATSRGGTAVQIITRDDPDAVAQQARALLHWRHSGVTPRIIDLPDPRTMILADPGGFWAGAAPDGGCWAAGDVGRALRILHSLSHEGAPRATDPAPELHFSGLTRDLAGSARRILGRHAGGDDLALLHGGAMPGCTRRGRGVMLYCPRPHWGVPAVEMGGYAARVERGDPLRALRGIWHGWGAAPGQAELAHAALAFATRLQELRDAGDTAREEWLAHHCERLLRLLER